MDWYRIGSRYKLILLLVIPSTLFVIIVTQIAKANALHFLRDTQNEALAGMAGQVVHLIGIYNNEITYNMLETEEIVKQEGGAGDRLYEAMHTVAKVRADFVRGVVYIGADGAITGYPSAFWGNFSAKEEALIHEQASRSRGVFEWSNTIRSDIGRSGTFGPTSIVTKSVYDDGGQLIGYLAFLVDLSAFLERSAAFAGSYETQTLLYDREDALIDYLGATDLASPPVLFSEEKVQTLSSALAYLDSRGVYHSVASMEANLGWKVVVVGDVEKLESRFEPLSQIAWAILLFGLAGFLCIHIAVSWWFTRPILLLTKGMRTVAKGKLDTKLAVVRRDEFGELANQFNRMTDTVRELISDLQRTEAAKRQSELQALLSQINPHFLYNTLNTIDMMVDFSPKNELHAMIHVLCRLLKYSLDGNEVRTLADELQYTKDYLYIQSVRYEHRFECRVAQAGDDLGRLRVLKLVLQPLVENAVFHGLHALEGRRGSLSVTTDSADGVLLLTVADNGVGMTRERLDALRAAMESEDGAAEDFGIGVRNVHRRIRLFYGPEYGIVIDSAEGEGTVMTIRLPAGADVRPALKEGTADG
ncbi:sensor histidine kinase [Cohnella sp. GbtcB17]|uniref:cache domain-containing sensor histidine kinase n=1 Tax=Cohnella sp. GbtcB17 TaxID=2824762 RepID=UPI001C2F715A|nr:histidine kinase [Cohnella sp. GbtcB17]